jgi:hypothetical protein
MRQEPLHLESTYLVEMALAVEHDQVPDLLQEHILGAKTAMLHADALGISHGVSFKSCDKVRQRNGQTDSQSRNVERLALSQV